MVSTICKFLKLPNCVCFLRLSLCHLSCVVSFSVGIFFFFLHSADVSLQWTLIYTFICFALHFKLSFVSQGTSWVTFIVTNCRLFRTHVHRSHCFVAWNMWVWSMVNVCCCIYKILCQQRPVLWTWCSLFLIQLAQFLWSCSTYCMDRVSMWWRWYCCPEMHACLLCSLLYRNVILCSQIYLWRCKTLDAALRRRRRELFCMFSLRPIIKCMICLRFLLDQIKRLSKSWWLGMPYCNKGVWN